MPQCEKCAFYNQEYDETLQEYDDTIIIGDDRERHHCTMYDDIIPPDVWYNGGDCQFFFDKEAD